MIRMVAELKAKLSEPPQVLSQDVSQVEWNRINLGVSDKMGPSLQLRESRGRPE